MEEIVLVTGSWVLWNTAGQTKLSGEEVRAAKKVGMYCVSLSTTWRGVPAEDDELLAMWEAMLP